MQKVFHPGGSVLGLLLIAAPVLVFGAVIIGVSDTWLDLRSRVAANTA